MATLTFSIVIVHFSIFSKRMGDYQKKSDIYIFVTTFLSKPEVKRANEPFFLTCSLNPRTGGGGCIKSRIAPKPLI